LLSLLSLSPLSPPQHPLPPLDNHSPQPALAPTRRSAAAPRSATAVRPAAALPPSAALAASNLAFSVAATVAEAKPGDVDAPFGAIALAAIVVTGASLLVAQGLQSGGSAAEKIFERDSKTGRRR